MEVRQGQFLLKPSYCTRLLKAAAKSGTYTALVTVSLSGWRADGRLESEVGSGAGITGDLRGVRYMQVAPIAVFHEMTSYGVFREYDVTSSSTEMCGRALIHGITQSY